ncbi:hypothetical protein [Chryseobacterium sp.]|uniref:hypothetical protein n=1 Tax=Chryseobacterium sp. TaxID=1871047 RepID=UPI0025C635EE|nr:hypothetical protein [Chryseobacterium sp.]
MEQIIQKLLNGLESRGWDCYKPLKDELLSHNTKDLIVKVITTESFRYTDVRSLLLIVPELWKDFSLEDWKYIMRKIDRPSNYRLYIDDSSYFEDIRFLYNWIGIDSISLYKNDPLLSSENKNNLDKVFPLFLHDTMRNGEEYKEDFNDGTFGNIKYFKEMKSKLISQGAKANEMGHL